VWLTAGVALGVGMAVPHTMFGTAARVIVAIGGIASGTAAYAFVYNIWRTIDGAPARRIAASNMESPPTVSVLRRASSR
jgi:hypothetical protein